jgi:hypothetical protein
MVHNREGKELVDIEGELRHETEKAYLLDHGADEPVWLPKSMCEWDMDSGTMTMPQWLAKDKGLI